MVTQTRIAAAAALLLVTFFAGAPAQAQWAPAVQYKPTVKGPVPSAVVLDFSVAPRVVESRDCCTRRIGYTEKEVVTEKDSRGWWLGRTDIYVNSNVGLMAADLITDQILKDCLYQLRSRGDLKYYYADKKDLINKKFKLSGDDLKKAILLLDPVKIGKEMGVDKVIVGHICDSELGKGTFPGSFGSGSSFTVAVFDVATGRIEFEKCYSKFSNHSTQYFHWEKIAEDVSRDLAFHRAAAQPGGLWGTGAHK